MNGECQITTLPLGSECNKKWFAAEKFGTKIQDTFFQDRSVTLECKNKGKQEYVVLNTLKCLVQFNYTSIHSCNICLPEIFRGLYILFLWFL